MTTTKLPVAASRIFGRKGRLTEKTVRSVRQRLATCGLGESITCMMRVEHGPKAGNPVMQSRSVIDSATGPLLRQPRLSLAGQVQPRITLHRATVKSPAEDAEGYK